MSELMTMEAGLPAHIASAFGVQANNDLTNGVNASYPILSYKGKAWHVVEGDTRNLVADDNGEPVPSLEVVILKANPNIGKTYYPSGYEEGSNERPVCYSNDSVAPAADSPEIQATKCAICPHNQFGSKITENGARGKACSDFRRLAVAPAGDLERPMLLRVPAASLKELVAYADMLNKRKVPYQALVTRVGFDHTVAYPKLSFKMVRWLDETQANAVLSLLDSSMVASITAENAVSPEIGDDEFEALGPAPAHVQPAAEVAAKPAATRKKAAVTPQEVEAAVGTTQKVTQPATGGFGGGSVATTQEAQPTAEPKATVLVEGAMAELDKVLSGFDD